MVYEHIVAWAFREGFDIEIGRKNEQELLKFVNDNTTKDKLHFGLGNKNRFLNGVKSKIELSPRYTQIERDYNRLIRDIENDSVAELVQKDSQVRSGSLKVDGVQSDRIIQDIDKQLKSEERKLSITQLAPPTTLSREIKRTGEYSPLFRDLISDISRDEGLVVRNENDWNALEGVDRGRISRQVTRRLTGR